jgi:hypothetical protein
LAGHQAGAFYDAIQLGQESSAKADFLGLIPFSN